MVSISSAPKNAGRAAPKFLRDFRLWHRAAQQTNRRITTVQAIFTRFIRDESGATALEYGLVAEEVAQVDPSLAIRDKNGQIDSVRYNAINAMLLNEFLKEHRKVQEQEAAITQLRKDFDSTIAQFTARLHEQAEQIQKVNAQLAAASPSGGGLEASKPAPQVVNNP